MSDITWTNGTRKLSDLVPWAHNPKRMTKKQAEGLKLSIERFGFAVPFLISPNNDIYDGHQRQTLMNAMKEHGGNAEVDVRVSSRLLTDDERRELIIRLKQNQAGWDFDMLPNLYDKEELLEWGFEPEELGMFDDQDTTDAATPEQARQTLAERFLVPPFSVLDARQGYWQTRKSAWLALGIQSELGRGENALDMSAAMAGITDPAAVAEWNTQRRESPRHNRGGREHGVRQ